MIRSIGTSTLAARSQPWGCHSNWPVAWASLSIENQQPASIARSSSSNGGSRRSGRELISTAVSNSAHAANTASASNSDGGRLPIIRPVQ